jgi:hypothetical protein
VTWAQSCLSQLLGTEVPQDGIIGPDTQQAIALFQAQQQLPSTSMLDDNTVAALQAACGGQQEGAFDGDTGEYEEFSNEEFDESSEERDVGRAGSGGTGRMVDPAKVDCERLDRNLPIFRAIGTTDPVSVLEAVCQRAVAMLDNTIAELTRISDRVRAGEPPAFPLIGDLLGWSLQTRMLMRADAAAAWTGSGPRTANQIIRWLTNIRRPNRGTDAATHLEFQAQTIINRVSHIYYGTAKTGRGPGSAYCINQFVADANGSPIRPEDIGRCGPGSPALHHEAELGEAYDIDEPEWQRWPTGTTFNPPPPQIIPAGPFTTRSPCEAILDDFSRLSLAVGDLKNRLRERPSNPGQANNRSDVVRAISRQIVARLQDLSYIHQACTREDLQTFASSVSVMRGGGADADAGSWPPAGSARAQGARTSARESLRHLLAWIHRAARRFPQI